MDIFIGALKNLKRKRTAEIDADPDYTCVITTKPTRYLLKSFQWIPGQGVVQTKENLKRYKFRKKNMSTQAIQPKQTFEEKMMSRIRDSIGELMSEEDLKKIIERGVDKAIFERPPNPGYGYNSAPLPSLMDKIFEEHFQARVSKAIDEWLAQNQGAVKTALDSAISAGIAKAVQRTLDDRFGPMFQMAMQSAKDNGLLKL